MWNITGSSSSINQGCTLDQSYLEYYWSWAIRTLPTKIDSQALHFFFQHFQKIYCSTVFFPALLQFLSHFPLRLRGRWTDGAVFPVFPSRKGEEQKIILTFTSTMFWFVGHHIFFCSTVVNSLWKQWDEIQSVINYQWHKHTCAAQYK